MVNTSGEAFAGQVPESATRVATDERGERTPFEAITVGTDLGSTEFVYEQTAVDDMSAMSEDFHEWYSVSSPFGGTIVPSVVAYLPPRFLFGQKFNVRGLAYKWEFENFRPIRVGSKITVHAWVTDKWINRDREFVRYEASFTDEDGEVLRSRQVHVLDFLPVTAPRSGVGIDSGSVHMRAAPSGAMENS